MKQVSQFNNKILKREESLKENGDMVHYAQLLDQAHKEGLKGISTRLVQIPNKENQFTTIIFAEVRTNRGIFTGHGDASPMNVDPEIAPHIIRAAETRAKARALRDAVNIGAVAIEELGFNPGKGGKNNETEVQGSEGKKDATETEKGKKGENHSPREKEQTSLMTERQRSYLFRLLADRGFLGDKAHEELKKVFGVDSLKKVGRTQAKGLIERLLDDADGSEGGNQNESD